MELDRRVCRSTVFIEMPYEKIKTQLSDSGYYDLNKNRPSSRTILTQLHPLDIISHYAHLARGLMNYYRCADNK